MPLAVGVRFKRAGRIYLYDPAGLDLKVGDWIVAEAPYGLALGWVVLGPREIPEGELAEPLKPVLRRAKKEDFEAQERLRERGKEAVRRCREVARKLNLPAKIISADYSLDGKQVLIYFTTAERIDFRAFLKELGESLGARAKLMQVGARDAAKLTGGIGKCGMPLCCITHLWQFESITVQMVRDQNLPLNPERLSGICGRLLCCLGFEHEFYAEIQRRAPKPKDRVLTPQGPGEVIEVNFLRETAKVLTEEGKIAVFPLEEVKPLPQGKEDIS